MLGSTIILSVAIFVLSVTHIEVDWTWPVKFIYLLKNNRDVLPITVNCKPYQWDRFVSGRLSSIISRQRLFFIYKICDIISLLGVSNISTPSSIFKVACRWLTTELFECDWWGRCRAILTLTNRCPPTLAMRLQLILSLSNDSALGLHAVIMFD